MSKGQGDVDWSEANKHRVKLIFVPYTVILFYMVQSCSGLNWKKLISVPYLKFLVRMVQPYLTEYENSVLCGSYILV